MTSFPEHRSRSSWLIGFAVVIAIAVALTLLVVYGGGSAGGY
jgi:hypothetical protein